MKTHISVYSRGSFENLPEAQLANKAIIRIHNSWDKNWYNHENNRENQCIQLFFDDLSINNLTWAEKYMAYHPQWKKILKYYPWSKQNSSYPLDLNQAKLLIDFIKMHVSHDFIIHCQYGRSRSVAVAVFIKNHFDGIIENKTEQELQHANTWVLEMLNKIYTINV
jgi:predicted protein tyrosine phosphatase